MSDRGNERRASLGKKRETEYEDQFDGKRSKRDEAVYGPQEITRWSDIQEYNAEDRLDGMREERKDAGRSMADGRRTHDYADQSRKGRPNHHPGRNGSDRHFERTTANYHTGHRPRDRHSSSHGEQHPPEQMSRGHQFRRGGSNSNYEGGGYNYGYEDNRDNSSRGSSFQSFSNSRDGSHKESSHYSGNENNRDRPYRDRPSRDRPPREKDTPYSKFNPRNSHDREWNRNSGYGDHFSSQERSSRYDGKLGKRENPPSLRENPPSSRENPPSSRENPPSSRENPGEAAYGDYREGPVQDDYDSANSWSDSRDRNYTRDSSHTESATQEVSLHGVVGTMLHKLASCSLKNKEDANLALRIINMFLKPLADYSYKNGDETSASLIKAAEINLKTLREQTLFSTSSVPEVTNPGHTTPRHQHQHQHRNQQKKQHTYHRHMY
ncbi:secretogranin-1-like isoform X2 [Penaeus chinensis]|uniref:secretogranin-1-like isoform X2 n=1 Tax=Penaeus chinensis TaxID=139456 RepID=UPI001FB69E53|nr:secretogranin-1-like isoform X2 [Penaeus chinensis]